jgi:hypothetical protein
VITIPHDDLAAEYRRGTLTARSYATQLWQQAIDEHPFLAAATPAEILGAIADLPREVAEALDRPDLLELARTLVTLPDAISGQTVFPITPTLLLIAWPERAGDPPARYVGRLEGRAGRIIRGGRGISAAAFIGPWVTMSLGALLVVAIDSAARLDSYEDGETAIPPLVLPLEVVDLVEGDGGRYTVERGQRRLDDARVAGVVRLQGRLTRQGSRRFQAVWITFDPDAPDGFTVTLVSKPQPK